jgi:hypothetical protein
MKNLFFIGLLIFAVSCAQDETHDNTDVAFFPIAGNINVELRELDSLPVGINKYTTWNGRTDTAVASREELKAAASELTTPDISDPAIKKYYKETVFYDKTSDHLTMSYGTESSKPTVKKIEVLIRQETGKVRSIFVEKHFGRNDSTVNLRMVWSPGRSLQLTDIASSGGKETVKNVKYAWGVGD